MDINVTLFLVSLLMLISLLISIYYKDLLHPLLVLTVPLTIQYWLYYIYLSDVYVLKEKTNALFVLAMFSFILGFMWITIFPKTKNRISIETNRENANYDFSLIKKFFVLIGLMGFGVGLLTAARFGLSGPGSFFFNLRYSNTVMNQNTGGISVYLMLFLQTITLYMIFFRKTNKTKSKYIILFMLLMLISAVFTMSRTNLLMGFASILGVYVFSNKHYYGIKIKKKMIAITIGAFALTSYFFAVGTNKTSNGDNFFFDYMAYPIITFDKWLLDFPYHSYGSQTFAFLYKIMGVFGGDYTPVDVGVPRGQFNTFTYMSAPYLDFGGYGVFFVLLGLGMIYGIVYRQVRQGKPYWVIMYSILLYPLIMSFFEYQYNLSTYIYNGLIMLSVFVFGRMFRAKKVKRKRKSKTVTFNELGNRI